MRTMPSVTDMTRAHIAGFGAAREVLDSLTDEVADFRCLDLT